MALKAIFESFEYHNTLVEKVQLLAYKIAEKNEVLAFIHASLLKEYSIVEKENGSSDPYRKRI